MYTMKVDTSYKTLEPTQHNSEDNNTDSCNWDRATHNMNYHLVVIFHKDVDKRPCRPVVQVVHLANPPATRSQDIVANPYGASILKTCQLCDPSTNSIHDFTIQHDKILCVYATGITDDEAAVMISNVSSVNTIVIQKQMQLSQRSNIMLMPLFIQKELKIGVCSIAALKASSTATDVQLAVLLVRESMNPARSICVRLRALHPYMATPENLHDAMSMFMRHLDLYSFRNNAFKFITTA
jgi:hypothetical protein